MVTFGLGIKFGITAFLAHLPLYNISYLWPFASIWYTQRWLLTFYVVTIPFVLLCKTNILKNLNVCSICVQMSRIQPLEQTLLLDKTIKNGLCPTAKAREQNPLLLIWSLI